MSKRPFAVFDIDGTLIRWQLYHALADELARRGHLDPLEFQKVREARMSWKKRAHVDSFTKYELALVELIDRAQTGIRVEELEAACQCVIDEYKDQVYTYTRDLIRKLRDKGYLLFAISASHAQIVGMVASHYGFDDFGGSIYEVKDGYFTGNKEVLRSTAKPEYLKKLIEKHHSSWDGSIAVGDSESDIPMLEIVQQPIAFNPTKKLFEHAKSKNWKIVVERKNMVYDLEKSDGKYFLAQPDV
jgi:HAD superfamily hydrolase (TIGR01490 family)